MKRKVLLVEDDHLQRDFLRARLEERLGVAVETRNTEWEFLSDFEAVAANKPDVAVFDLMLRWATPSRNMAPAPEVVTNNPGKAGLRCAKRLHDDPRTRDVKVIIYSS